MAFYFSFPTNAFKKGKNFINRTALFPRTKKPFAISQRIVASLVTCEFSLSLSLSPVMYEQGAESQEPRPKTFEPVKEQGVHQPNSKTSYSLHSSSIITECFVENKADLSISIRVSCNQTGVFLVVTVDATLVMVLN